MASVLTQQPRSLSQVQPNVPPLLDRLDQDLSEKIRRRTLAKRRGRTAGAAVNRRGRRVRAAGDCSGEQEKSLAVGGARSGAAPDHAGLTVHRVAVERSGLGARVDPDSDPSTCWRCIQLLQRPFRSTRDLAGWPEGRVQSNLRRPAGALRPQPHDRLSATPGRHRGWPLSVLVSRQPGDRVLRGWQNQEDRMVRLRRRNPGRRTGWAQGGMGKRRDNSFWSALRPDPAAVPGKPAQRGCNRAEAGASEPALAAAPSRRKPLPLPRHGRRERGRTERDCHRIARSGYYGSTTRQGQLATTLLRRVSAVPARPGVERTSAQYQGRACRRRIVCPRAAGHHVRGPLLTPPLRFRRDARRSEVPDQLQRSCRTSTSRSSAWNVRTAD